MNNFLNFYGVNYAIINSNKDECKVLEHHILIYNFSYSFNPKVLELNENDKLQEHSTAIESRPLKAIIAKRHWQISILLVYN